MESISIFDIFKVGIGPSSSHTMGPWKAAQAFANMLLTNQLIDSVEHIDINLYGSLALTGKGHGTDMAIQMGLQNCDITTSTNELIQSSLKSINENKQLHLASRKYIKFSDTENINFQFDRFLDYHSNALSFRAIDGNGDLLIEEYYYSTGGGFITDGITEVDHHEPKLLPYPIETGKELIAYCKTTGLSISQIVLANESASRSPNEINEKVESLWEIMLQCAYDGVRTAGILPGGLNVKRRAFDLNKRLIGTEEVLTIEQWLKSIDNEQSSFDKTLEWISTIAIAVNEENANYGKVVTAPTNGAAGVIPAVIFYHLYLSSYEKQPSDLLHFFLVAGEIGSLFKKKATISAAMGGCQAEIGVSSAMAAAALTEVQGGSPQQVMMAAEIAMEHHLGLTCDPIGGLVQIPCIERNSIGAIKAITASKLALSSDPEQAKVSLDQVIASMHKTAIAMHSDYKETSKGGLAITVGMAEC